MGARFTDEEFTLAELAERVDMLPRTIRSYIEQGLLRGPEIGGRGARYGRYHLQRLQAIRVLKDLRGLPLAEVRRQLMGMTAEEIAELAGEGIVGSPLAAPPPAPGSALQYLRSIQGKPQPEPERKPAGPTPMDVLLARLERLSPGLKPARRARGEVWTTIPLTKDVELRVRGTLPSEHLARWERIADHLRDILLGPAEVDTGEEE